MDMKRICIALAAAGFLFVAACGGGSGGGGGGGGLDVARVSLIYKLISDGTPLKDLLEPLFRDNLLPNCPVGGTAGPVNVNIPATGCQGGGTWSYTAQVNCYQNTVGPTVTMTIESVTGSSMVLEGCASTVNVEGTPYSVVLDGNVSPLTMTNTTVTAQGVESETPVVRMNGTADIGHVDTALTGDVTATATFTRGIVFTNFDPVGDTSSPTCESSEVTATEAGQSGTCTIQTDCDCT
jgi:hypothetical protein